MPAITLTDPRFEPETKEKGSVQRFFESLIADPRDLPFVYLSLQMTLTLVPAGIAMYIPGVFHWWIVPFHYAVLYFVFLDRFMLMLHNTSHRRLYKREYNLLNKWITWIIGPFTGQSFETYQVHHITMHHAEGNLPKDLSSTMKYQRDSFIHWLRYFGRFFFFVMPELIAYQLRKKRYRVIQRMLIGEGGFLLMCAGLCFVNWQATLVVFLVPYLVIRILMMCGNWGQHAFVDPDEPDNDYKSSITCINARYNRRAFNDGYHISHHLMATRHWTEHPEEFESNLEKYIENDAIIFEGIDFFMVWVFLMLKRYDTLAKHFVELRDEPRPKEEIIALFKRRLRAFPKAELAAYS